MRYYNNKKLALSIFWLILGITQIVLSILEIIDSTYFSGVGGALAAVGTLQIYKNLKYRSDPEYQEQLDIQMSDERNRLLRLMSWSWAAYITILANGVGSILAYFLHYRTISLCLSFNICFTMIIYLIAYVVLNKRY